MCFELRRLTKGFADGLADRSAKLLPGPMLLLLALASGSAWPDDSKMNEINMSPGVTSVGSSIYDLHMAIFWICVAIGVVVFGVMFYSIIVHRKSRGVTPATFHESTQVEIAWTVVPFLILLGMAVPVLIHLLSHKWQVEYFVVRARRLSRGPS